MELAQVRVSWRAVMCLSQSLITLYSPEKMTRVWLMPAGTILLFWGGGVPGAN
jgi:hypothetical protein